MTNLLPVILWLVALLICIDINGYGGRGTEARIYKMGEPYKNEPPPPPVPANSTDNTTYDFLGNWRIQMDDRIDVNPGVFEYCDITTRCYGLPSGCIQADNCQVFVEIAAPKTPKGPFHFWMYLLLGEEHAHENPRYWIGIGLNKDAERMGGSNVMLCYFRNDANGNPDDGIYYGWTDGTKGVIPVEEAILGPHELNLPESLRRHITNVTIVRENRDTLFKCYFERKQETAVRINPIEYPDVAAATNGNSTYFNLKSDLYVIMATGELGPELENGLPKIHRHTLEDRISTDKGRLAQSHCQVFAWCLGIGSDGCEHATDVPCSMSLETEQTGEDKWNFHTNKTQWWEYWYFDMRTKASGFIALAISNGSNSGNTIPNLRYLVSCNKQKGYRLGFHELANCTRDPNSTTSVNCDTQTPDSMAYNFQEQNPQNPFYLVLLDVDVKEPGIKCAPIWVYYFLEHSTSFPYLHNESYYFYLISNDKGDFDDEPGKIHLEITEDPSEISIRSRKKVPLNVFPYGEFFVLSSEESESNPHQNRTLGTAGDPNFGESRATSRICFSRTKLLTALVLAALFYPLRVTMI